MENPRVESASDPCSFDINTYSFKNMTRLVELNLVEVIYIYVSQYILVPNKPMIRIQFSNVSSLLANISGLYHSYSLHKYPM